jgi:hypothetical protein
MAVFTSFACDNNAVSMGQEFSLRVGESMSIKGEKLQIRFLKVTEDSRCPKGAVCVWEGRVSCLVEITNRGSVDTIVLTEPGSISWPPEEIYKEYKISYHVEPYPQAVTRIAENEYLLFLRINK